MYEPNNTSENTVIDYSLIQNKIELKEGRWPTNDYEVIVNIDYKDEMTLNKEIDKKVNNKKLKVVGYYFSKDSLNGYLVNSDTVKYDLIVNSSNITVKAKNKEKALNKFKNMNINIQDSYEKSKQDYIKEEKESMVSSLVVTGIILAISLIEIYLMVRSSFLSRIKEIGIFRAIGIKRMDIYKMFLGEIIAITTIASIPGVVFMTYIINAINGIEYMSGLFLINPWIILACVMFIYAFNIFVGLLPVFNVVRKTPSEILARHDLD